MDRKENVIEDLDGRKIVVINDIRFKGKRKINWEEMLISHAADGNLYLYDMVNIKKKRAPRLSNSCAVTNPFLIGNTIVK